MENRKPNFVMENCGEGFIDRRKVRILLCDNDSKSSEEVFKLLCKCSYQVTSVRSPRQVIDALNAEGPDLDIILSEIDLPMSKGFKMLKYIMRDKDLRRIPVIMMSSQDEVPIVVKCLKFGAADYLVKPLRTNELLNLWTHMWRRRRMLGLAEKNILNYDFDLVVSDTSDANTNSTTLFSDDTDDKSKKSVNPDACISTHNEDEGNAGGAIALVEAPFRASSQCQPDVPRISDRRTGQISPFQKNSELKIGESSAFFTYVKSSVRRSITQGTVSNHGNIPQHSRDDVKCDTFGDQVDAYSEGHAIGDSQENHTHYHDYPSSNSLPDSFCPERSQTPPLSLELSQENSNEFYHMPMHPGNESHHDVSGFQSHSSYPYYIPGVMDQVIMASSPMYQKNIPDLHNHSSPSMVPQYNHFLQCPQMPGMASLPYYPVGFCLQPGQMPTPHPWPSYGNYSSNEKGSKVDRRGAALMKFRQKRKERCFDRKIRYVNRKKLAERRPRVRGQFVRKVNGVNVDLSGPPASAYDDEVEEEDDEEDQATTNIDS